MEINDYVEKVLEVSKLSPAQKRKVGAIIVDQNTGNIISQGFNYNINKKQTCCENLNGETFDTVVHAEEDAIINLVRNPNADTNNMCMYVTYTPCINCCRLIINAGIKILVYLNKHAKNFDNQNQCGSISPKDLLLSHGIKVYEYNENKLKLIPLSTPVIVYHSADIDGLMSAYIMEQIYPTALMYGYNYESNPKYLEAIEMGYRHFIFVDISPNTDFLEQVDSDYHIELFDHHITRVEHVINYLKRTDCYFVHSYEKDNSGCLLVYNYITKNTKTLLPAFLLTESFKNLVNIVSQYDTWKFVNLLTEKQKIVEKVMLCMNNLYNNGYDEFKKTMDYVSDYDEFITECLQNGNVISKLIEKQTKHAIQRSILFTVDTYNVVVVYEGYPNLMSDKIIQEHHKIKDNVNILYIGYTFKPTEITFAVRLLQKTENKLKVPTAENFAKLFGGGGHRCAAGFRLDIDEGTKFLQRIYNGVSIESFFV